MAVYNDFILINYPVVSHDKTDPIDHYVLDDGRIWSVKLATFVNEAPSGAVKGPCPDEQGGNTIEGLLGCLEYYGYDKGELA